MHADFRQALLLLGLGVAPNLLHSEDCLLVVSNATGSPSITRSNGNQVSGSATFQTVQRVKGDWTAYLTAHLNFRAAGSATWVEVATKTGSPGIIYDGTIQAGFGSGTVSTTLDSNGNGDYQITFTSNGRCGGSTHDITPSDPTPSAVVSVTRPTITSNGIAGMWWLEGESDAGGGFYDTAQIVGSTNASGYSGQLTYQLVSGGTKAKLTCTKCNTTGVKATGPSATCMQDVEVRASLDGFSAVSTVKLAVNTFKTARRYTPQPPVNDTSSWNGGWRTVVGYHVVDICESELRIPISVNETFGTRTPVTSQWVLPTMHPGLVIPFADEIAVAPPQAGALQPTTPLSPLGNTLADSIPFYARLGSQQAGKGLLVMSTDQQRYVDHGDHSVAPYVQ
jgi:hypothetical protein